MVSRRAGRAAGLAALGLAGAICVLALTSCSRASGAGTALAAAGSTSGKRGAAVRVAAHSTYTLMQMNLCLSGLASCYRNVVYPAVLSEAAAWIRQTRPDAITFSEACGNDVALIARRTGYHARFSSVIYGGKPFRCIRPGGRGFFGDAVLTKDAVESSDSQAFELQTDIEWRQWLCVTTRSGIAVCTAHLSQRIPIERAANDGQCVELSSLLARRAIASPVIFGGDLNRQSSCAPDGFWTRSDRSARQDPGLQQAYGTSAFRSPAAKVIPATHSDHDILLVRTQLTR